MQARARILLAALALLPGACGFRASGGETSEVAAAADDLLRQLAGLGELQAGQLASVRADADGRFVHSMPADGSSALAEASSTALADTYHDDTHVALTLPREHVKTVSSLARDEMEHFFGSPAIQKHRWKNHLAMPDSFVMALWLLYQRFGVGKPHGEPLWAAYIAYHDAAKTGEHVSWVWSTAELAVFEEPRMVESAMTFRNSSIDQYDKLLSKMCEAFPDFFPQMPRRIFKDALAVAISQMVDVDGIDEQVLMPFPIRQHPVGPMELEEVEQERLSASGEVRTALLVNLVTATTSPPRDGTELVVRSRHHNDELLLLGGYMWPEMAASSVPLRMWIDFSAKRTAARRSQLLRLGGLNATQDFSLTVGALPPRLMTWSRIMLATDSEVEAAFEAGESTEPFGRPMGAETEYEVFANLLASLQGVRLALSEHEQEEDEYLLAELSTAEQAALADGAAGAAVAAAQTRHRNALAIRHRLLSKTILDEGLQRVISILSDSEKAKKAAIDDGKPKRSYSNQKQRKAEEKAARAKEAKRAEVRRRREQKEAAAAAFHDDDEEE